MIEIRQLRHVLALAEHGNFKRAAKSLGISQPALSKSIQRLEIDLSVALFDRGTKSVSPTQFGRSVIERARRITAEYDAIPGEIDLLAGLHRGELFVGTGPLLADTLIAESVARLIGRHPKLRVVIQIDNWRSLTEALVKGEISLFVADTSEASADRHLNVTPLPSVPGVWFARAGHPLRTRSGLTFSDLIDYPTVSPKVPERIIAWIEEHRRTLVRPERLDPWLTTVECDDYALIKRLVRASDGVSFAPWTNIADEVMRGGLVKLDVTEPIFHTSSGIVTLKDRSLPPAARALIDELLAIVGKSSQARDGNR